jgi:tetratricopeptide (TPR) repeat protein
VNVAVHVHDEYQIVFPPDVIGVTDHSKRAVAHYPFARERYYGVDYSGVDLRWYKNLPVPSSYFCLGSEYDFFGGYDHRHRAGLVHVANHHISPGKKMFTWGNRAFGQAWERNLTDADGPYIELMAGVYTDNQPDFSWLQPYETKTFSQFWYPVQQIGPPVMANRQVALNLECEGQQVRLGVCVTQDYPQATIRLAAGDQKLFERTVDLEPGTPALHEIELPEGVVEADLYLQVSDASGTVLIAYRPETPSDEPLPEPMTPPPLPTEMETIEELYLAGLHLEQYRHPTIDPEPYWERALQLDAGDARTNNALGLVHLRRGNYALAEEHFERTIKTLTRRNPNPRDGEPYYNLGLTLKYGRRFDEAYDAFYKAIWSYAWQAPAYYALAEIDCLHCEFERALEHLDRSLLTNACHLKARNLKTAVLRRLGRHEEAQAMAQETIDMDPLDFWSRNERVLISRAQEDGRAEGQLQELSDLLRVDSPVTGTGHEQEQVCLDIAFDYASTGLWVEADDWLGRLLDGPDAERMRDPMVLYALGFYAGQQGWEAQMHDLYRRASKMSPELVFHARLEELEILQHVLTVCPEDARAHYYLGNLLYDKRRYEGAMEHWEAACRLEPGFSIPWRNLGVAWHNVRHDRERARSCYERALEVNPHDGRLLSELDQLAKRMGEPPNGRLDRLEAHLDLVALRDDLTAERAALYNQLGQPQVALDIVLARRFHPWEGGEGLVSDQYEMAHMLLGQAALEAGQAQEAIEHFYATLTYPDNLGEGRRLYKPDAGVHYHAGLAHEVQGDRDGAKTCFEQAAAPQVHLSAATYYQALAMRKLGGEEAARGRLEELRDHALRSLEEGRESGFATSVPSFVFFEDDPTRGNRIRHSYMLGLAHLGLDEIDAARQAFKEVLALDVNHLGAQKELRRLDDEN